MTDRPVSVQAPPEPPPSGLSVSHEQTTARMAIREASNRADWCENWFNRGNVQRPEITSEWVNLVHDVRVLCSVTDSLLAELERLERQRLTADLLANWWRAVYIDDVCPFDEDLAGLDERAVEEVVAETKRRNAVLESEKTGGALTEPGLLGAMPEAADDGDSPGRTGPGSVSATDAGETL